MSNNWLQNIPQKWDTIRLKNVVKLKTDRIPGTSKDDGYVGLENIQSWTGKLLSSEKSVISLEDNDEKQNIVNVYSKGDVLFGKLRPYLAKAHLAQYSGICSTELLVIKPGKHIDSRYLLKTILAKEFIDQVNAETYGVKMPRADWSTVGNISIPLPPLPTQRAIAAYLDRETAMIDAMIAAKQRLLALLAEKRRALIMQAVTRGLDQHAPMKDSGVEWIGKVPEHWSIGLSRRFICDIEQGWSPIAEERRAEAEEWAVIKLSAVKNGRFIAEEHKALPANYDIPSHLEIQTGDFLLTRANTPLLVGDVCVVGETRSKLILSDLVYRVMLRSDQIDANYFKYFLLTPVGRSQIETQARGSSQSMVKISQDHIQEWVVPLPPLAEQQAIASLLDDSLGEMVQLQVIAEQTIDLLHERRAALISEAVTGQTQIAE